MEYAEPVAALIARFPSARRALAAALCGLLAAPLAVFAQAQAPAPDPAHSAAAVARPAPRELVVVVHGMGRSSFSMLPLASALEDEGYEVLRFGYSSVCCSIPELGEQLREAVDARMRDEITQVHFVGHSLGNILVRWVLTRDTLPPRVGRVVMLAPPNQGAEAADRFASVAGWLLRPIDELRTDTSSTVHRLPPVRGVEIGVISARDDRTVKLTETHLEEESAHIVVSGGHSFIMRREEVIVRVSEFLRTGRFAMTGPLAREP